MKILVVDDVDINLKLLRAQLEAEGHSVLDAKDGIKALAHLNAEDVDLVISDILMPLMDGYRLCYEIRKDIRFANLPFIFYTATYTSPGDEKLSYEIGADFYMKKPASANEIKRAISEVMKNRPKRKDDQINSFKDLNVMKEYNAALVKKLEEKFNELGKTNQELRASEEQNRVLYESAQRRLSQTLALRDIDKAISNGLDLRFTLDVVLSQVINELKADAADVSLYDPVSHVLEFFTGKGYRTVAFDHSQLSIGEGFAGKALLERKRVDIADLRESTKDFPNHADILAEGFVDYHVVPLIAKGKVLGALTAIKRNLFAADPEWLNFLETLAGQAAIAIDNISLVEGLQSANNQLVIGYDATIQGWSRALDLRDEETEDHTRRVTALAVTLAKRMGLKGEDLVHIRRGALLHDIGKMALPDSILLKPDQLTDYEWVLMKKHPQSAYDMLSPILYLRLALDIPFYHHEKWDGSGYPTGLAGEAIPLAARLFAVVDVYDALTSDRRYRKAWSNEKTLNFIQEQSGKHFDPRVVAAFLDSEIWKTTIPGPLEAYPTANHAQGM